MNNLLFTALAIALIYYFFFYLPTPKKLNANPPFKHQETQTLKEVENKEVQTEPEIENKDELITSLKTDIQQKESTIIGLNNSYERLEQSSQRLETKKDEQINELKKELELVSQEVNFFTKNKELIKDAIEFHLNHASFFTSVHANPRAFDMPSDWEWQEITKPSVPEYTELGIKAPEWIDYQRKLSWNAFLTQKQKNERIVKEGKELLEKLKDYE